MTPSASNFLNNHLEKEQSVLFFDGICAVCNRSVQFILSQESEKKLLFATLQSSVAKNVEDYFDLDFDAINSLALYHKHNVFVKSTAVLKLIPFFKWYWQVFRILWIIPIPIRDFLYDWIAQHRYTWFGKTDSCIIPHPDDKSRFIDTLPRSV